MASKSDVCDTFVLTGLLSKQLGCSSAVYSEDQEKYIERVHSSWSCREPRMEHWLKPWKKLRIEVIFTIFSTSPLRWCFTRVSTEPKNPKIPDYSGIEGYPGIFPGFPGIFPGFPEFLFHALRFQFDLRWWNKLGVQEGFAPSSLVRCSIFFCIRGVFLHPNSKKHE